MDFEFLMLLGLGLLLLGPISFFMALAARSHRVRQTEQIRAEVHALHDRLASVSKRLTVLELRLDGAQEEGSDPVGSEPIDAEKSEAQGQLEGLEQQVRDPARTTIPLAQENAPAGRSELELQPVTLEAEPFDTTPPELVRISDKPSSPGPHRTIEEILGTRWTVWIGGLALALGALLLVRYSIESGFFGPGVRTITGFILALVLIGAGEFLRRTTTEPILTRSSQSAYIPGILTAAGTIAAFGSIFAAHALYGFIGPSAALLALGATGVGAMLAAAVHGPALAGLGLVGSLATPLLVSSNQPNPWPVVLYLGAVVLAAYFLARLRQWLWLTLASAAGACAWGMVFRFSIFTSSSVDVASLMLHAALLHMVLQTGFASFFLGLDPHRGKPDEPSFDFAANSAVAGFALVSLCVLNVDATVFDVAWMAAAASIAIMLCFLGARVVPVAGASALSGLVVLGAMIVWPPADSNADFAGPLFDVTGLRSAPTAQTWFAVLAALGSIGVAAVAGRKLLSGRDLPFFPASIYAATAALTPLGSLVIADLRLEHNQPSPKMAVAAALTGLAFVFATQRFRNQHTNSPNSSNILGLGALASAAIAAVALALVFVLDGANLTVAYAVAAAGVAFVEVKLSIAALRWCFTAICILIAGRLFLEPRAVSNVIGPTPVFNWFLFVYGVPAIAFGVASRFLRQRAEDTPARIADSMMILFSAFLVFFEIRHALNGGDPFAPTSGLIEQALLAVSSFGFAIVLTRLDSDRRNIVFCYASLAAGSLGMILAAVTLLIRYNPLVTGRSLVGGMLLNALTLGYLVPALVCSMLAYFARSVRPLWYWAGAGVLACVLGVTYVTLQIRVFFHGTSIGWDEGAGIAELGIHASVLFALASALLWTGPQAKLLVRGARICASLGAAVAILGLALFANPLLNDEPIGGSLAFDPLLIGYGLPALLTLLLARSARRFQLTKIAATAAVGAIAFFFAFATLEVRHGFQGTVMSYWCPTSDEEWYTYSVVWMIQGIVLLGYGVWRESHEIRLASAVFIVVTVAKVFLFDLAGLEGILRALSFIGLGLALMSIGLVYQKIVFAPKAGKVA